MQNWRKEFTLNLGNGESYQPYDTTVIQRLVERVKQRGHTFPEDAANIERTFGLGLTPSIIPLNPMQHSKRSVTLTPLAPGPPRRSGAREVICMSALRSSAPAISPPWVKKSRRFTTLKAPLNGNAYRRFAHGRSKQIGGNDQVGHRRTEAPGGNRARHSRPRIYRFYWLGCVLLDQPARKRISLHAALRSLGAYQDPVDRS